MRLTDLSIRSLKKTGVQYAILDDVLPNFGVRVGEGGTISFFVMYRVHGRRRRDTLGKFPILSLADARKLAKQRFARLVIDAKSPEISSATTFAEAVDDFLETHCFVQNRPSTAAETKRLLEKHWLPVFKRRLLQDVATRDITLIIDRLRRQAPSEAAHAFSAIRKFFNWAKQRRLVAQSPCEGLEFGFRAASRARVLNEGELVAVFRAAEKVGFPYGTIVQLLMVTGQRRGEITGLRRSYINEREKLITLPAVVVKNNREHVFAYGDLAGEILAKIPNQGDLLFPARGYDDRPYCGWGKGKAALDKQCDVDFTLHDLRRSWATHVANRDVHPWVIEAHLNHVSGVVSGVAAIYNRNKYLAETRVAVVRFEEMLTGLLNR